MAEWRPKGWENPFPTTDKKWLNLLTGYGDWGATFEAGADAMMAALKEGAKIPDGEGGFYKLTHWLKRRKAEFSGILDEEYDAGPHYGNDGGTDEAIHGMPTSDARKRLNE